MTTEGTYFVDVEVSIDNTSTTNSLAGFCSVGAPSGYGGVNPVFSGSFELPSNDTLPFSFSGMVTASSERLDVSCEGSSGNTVDTSSVHWWYSPIGS